MLFTSILLSRARLYSRREKLSLSGLALTSGRGEASFERSEESMETDEYLRELIARLRLEPLEKEGGLYRQSYRSPEAFPESALPEGCRGGHPAGTAILYLYLPGPYGFSAMHLLPSDEIYHFYLGDPVEMLLLYPDGTSGRIMLGQDVLGGQRVQFVVPRGAWQGSRLAPGGSYALAGTTMAPGFAESDYLAGDRGELARRYPGEREAILRLTRIDNARTGV
jgi:predicted cupin superfamily sugar epimerase